MSANAHARGHRIKYIDNKWVYEDNGEEVNDRRPCSNCGRPPTKLEGHDACIGHVEGCTDACCGHGGSDRRYTKGCR